MSEFTKAELAATLGDVVNKMQVFADSLVQFSSGGATDVITDPPGQPAPGWIPIKYTSGIITWAPSIAALRAEANSGVVERRGLTSGSTHILTVADTNKTLLLAGTSGTSNINARVPSDARPGWRVTLIQEGSGGPRITVTAPTVTNADGTTDPLAYIRQRGSAFRSTNQWALVPVICVTRDSSGRPTFVIGGDVVQ